jgi:spore coat protein U-like protein
MKMLLWLLVILAGLLPVPASAQFASASCNASAQPVAFGNYNPLASGPNDSAGTVNVTCSLVLGLSLLVSYNISLSTGGSGSYAARSMSSGSNALSYNLFTDATRLLVWGNGAGGTSRISNSYLLGALPIVSNHPVYGRIPAGQNVPPGVYGDTILVTVEY